MPFALIRSNRRIEIPLLAGRSLTAGDDARAPKVVVVNQTFAKRYFPDEDPIGKRFSFDSNTKPGLVEIIGLARDTKYARQRDEVPPTAYLPWLQELSSLGTVTFEVRTTGEPNESVAAIRSAVRDVESNLPVNNIRTQIEQADETLAMERLFAKLVGLFGLLAQQLAHPTKDHLALFQAVTDGEVDHDYGRPGINHFGFVVDDLEEARRRLERLGARVHFEPHYEPGRRIYFLDPTGHEVELVQY